MDGVTLNKIPKRIRAEENAASDLYVIDTPMEDVIPQRLGAYSEHLRGSGDIEQTLEGGTYFETEMTAVALQS